MHRTMLACAVMAIGALASSGCETEFVTPLVAVRLTVEPHTADLAEGDEVQLTATVLDGADRTVTRAVVDWSTDDRSLVHVDEDGRARGLAPGSTLVWASYQGVEGSALITVLSAPECAVVAHKPKDKPRGKKDEKGKKGDDDDDDEGEDDEDDEDDEDIEDGDDDSDGDGGDEDGNDDSGGDDDDGDDEDDDDGPEADEDEAQCTPPNGA